jgi:hypothetical protein
VLVYMLLRSVDVIGGKHVVFLEVDVFILSEWEEPTATLSSTTDHMTSRPVPS